LSWRPPAALTPTFVFEMATPLSAMPGASWKVPLKVRASGSFSIVLRVVNYGESDRIVTLLGRDTGRLSALARGARKSQRSRQSGDAGSGDNDMTRLRHGRNSRCRSGGFGKGQRALRRARRMRIKR